jgi:hypothetical protein
MARKRQPRRREVYSINVGMPATGVQPDDRHAYPEEHLYRDTAVGALGEPIDCWLFELVYRYAVYRFGDSR